MLPEVYPYRIIHKSGQCKWVELKVALSSWEERPATLCFMTDISDRKHAEEILLEYQKAFEGSEELISAVNRQYDYSLVNEAFLRYHCLNRDQVIGRNIVEIIGEEIFESIIKPNAERCFKGEPVDFEMKHYYPEYGERYMQMSNYPLKNNDGEMTGMVVVARDVTVSKMAAEGLKESEEKYRSLVESTEDSIYLVDRNSTYLFMNEKHLSRLGLQPDEILGRIYGEFHSEDDTQEFAALMEKIFETGQSIQQEHRSLKDNRHFLRTLSPIKGPKGRTRAITVVSKDITERGRLEEVLRESEEKFRTFTEMAPVGVFVTDADGLTTYWNKRLCEITGMQVVDGLGAGWADGVHPDDRERVFKEWYESAEKRASFSCEYRFVDRDGAVTYTIGQAIPLIDASSCVTGYVGTITDVTDLKRAEAALRESEEKLARSEKMEAMGLMAGGVGHDLNNILSGVVSLPELLLMNLPEDSPIRKPIKTIQESGMRAADVVEDLMTIARGVASSKEPLNLNTMVEEYLKSAEHFKLERTHSFVSFKMELDPDLLNMNGSPTHIKKILMNLAANASEAIEGSGTVTISTLNQYLDMPLKGYEDVRTGEYAVVTVSDDGSGISPGDLERIFEPFYTKKVMGRAGTGLGLAVVWNTTQDYNGYINVNSSEKGTTFELYFPVTREEVADEGEEIPLKDYLGHSERILVVDDDENQKEIASGMLTQLGYNAESVSSGEDAIEYIKEHSVDLIVLDMVMPKGINGRKTYEEIIKIRPGQKAIIASGHAQSKEVDIAQELGAGKYVKKPYILEKIGVAVKEELEK